MNFDQAVRAHVDWKMKLRDYSAKPDKSLDPATVEADNRCDLGKWIYGEGAKYGSDPDFQELRKEHANFHRAAAALVRRADKGENVSGDTQLGAKSPFALLSEHVVQLIMKMKQKNLAPAGR